MEQANMSVAMTMAYREFEYETAKDMLLDIASNLIIVSESSGKLPGRTLRDLERAPAQIHGILSET